MWFIKNKVKIFFIMATLCASMHTIYPSQSQSPQNAFNVLLKTSPFLAANAFTYMAERTQRMVLGQKTSALKTVGKLGLLSAATYTLHKGAHLLDKKCIHNVTSSKLYKYSIYILLCIIHIELLYFCFKDVYHWHWNTFVNLNDYAKTLFEPKKDQNG